APNAPRRKILGAANRRHLTRALQVLIALVLFGLAWEALVVLLALKPHQVPRLSLVLQAVIATPQPYLEGLLRTGAEALLGFAAGAVFGVAVGIAFFRQQVLRDMV